MINGYIKNASPGWKHAMKRAVGPGEEVPIDVLYAQYGKKHGLEDGEAFIEWLRNVKLKNKKEWLIVVENDTTAKQASAELDKEKDNSQNNKENINDKKYENVTPMVVKDLEIKDIISLSVRDARVVVPKINDLNLLRYAIKEANQLAGKDSLCRILNKRISELQISR